MKMLSKPAAKFDLLREFKSDYAATSRPARLTLRPASYLAIAGSGRPGDEQFVAQIGALYAAAFTTKMQRKVAGARDYTIGKLEARWPDFQPGKNPPWKWELMIRTPDFVEQSDLSRAVTTLRARGQSELVETVKLVSIEEAQCVQMLHTGPYDEESKTIAQMIAWAAEQGFGPAGPIHEIYLSDARRVPPAKLRTILRLPVQPTTARENP